eukprot:8536313-Alexandrium_andersonii.AAC.1
MGAPQERRLSEDLEGHGRVAMRRVGEPVPCDATNVPAIAGREGSGEVGESGAAQGADALDRKKALVAT